MAESRSSVKPFKRNVAELFVDEIDGYVPAPGSLPWSGHRHRKEQVAECLGTMWSHLCTEQARVVPGDLVSAQAAG